MRSRSAILALALLAGCTTGPDYAGPPAVGSAGAARGRFARAEDPALAAAPPLARWWEALGDPTLNALVDRALADSPDVAVAQAKVAQARARARAQDLSGRPTLSANGTYVHAQLPGVDIGTEDDGGAAGSRAGAFDSTLNFYNLGLNASWEPDLSGGARRAGEQARAELEAQAASLADAQVSLTAQVATAYVDLRDVQARLRLSTGSADLQRRALALTRQRVERGTAATLEVERLDADLQRTLSDAIPLEAQAIVYRDQLALLTGQEPGGLDAALAAAAPVPLPPATVAVGDPAALIARRPDIRAAERALAAGSAGIGVARAKALPGIRFMGILGLGGTNPGDVFDLGKLTTILAPMLSWSFLDFGRNRAAVAEAEAKRDEAEARYRQAVLAGLQDAEGALARFGATRRQLGRLADAEAAAARAATLNAQRVKAGTASMIDQLDVERQRLAAAIAVAQAKAQLTATYIAVNKSLGLGWGEAPAR